MADSQHCEGFFEVHIGDSQAEVVVAHSGPASTPVGPSDDVRVPDASSIWGEVIRAKYGGAPDREPRPRS